MPQNGGGNGGSGNGGSGQSTVVKAAKAAKAKAAAKVAGARAAHLERIEQHAQWMAGGPRTQAEFEEHGANLRRGLRALRSDFRRLPTHEPLDVGLNSFLSARTARLRRSRR